MNILPLILLAAILTLLARAADPLSEALQRGLLAEEAQRDLSAASAAYQEAVRLGDAQRAIVATALFRLAESERRQGRTNEALAFYRRLVLEYPDATNLTVLARRYLPLGGGRSSDSESVVVLRNDLDANVASWEKLRERRRHFATQTNDPVALARIITVDYATPLLSQLLTDYGVAEVKLAELKVTYGPKHPQRMEAEARCERLRQTLADVNNGILQSLSARETEMESWVTMQRENLARLTAGGTAVSQPDASMTEGQRLLKEEIALAEQQLEVVKRRQEAGRAETEEVLKASREVLALKRQLAAMPRLQDLQVVPPLVASEGGDEEDKEIARLQRMLANSPDLLNAPQGSDNETPLQTAARQDQARVVEYLLKSGADINGLGSSGTTALFKAASAGHKRMVDLLLRSGAKVDARGKGNITPLLGAVARERAQVIQTLLAAGASPTMQCGEGGVSTRLGGKSQVSPLGLALLFGNRTLVEQMVKGGADLNLPASKGSSSLQIALDGRDWNLMSLLLELGADPNWQSGAGSLFDALVQIQTVPAVILDQFLARGGRLDVTNASGDTLLHLATRAKATNTVPWLLAHGVDPDLVNSEGRSPLMDLVILLLNQNGSPQELQAVERQVDALLALQVNVNRTLPNDGAPLSWLARSGNTNVFRKLLAAGADPNSVGSEGKPLLSVIANLGNQSVEGNELDRKRIALANARSLLMAGANPNVEWVGNTPLDAALGWSAEMVQLLLDFKADPNRRNGKGRTALEELANVRGNVSSGVPLLNPLSKDSLAQVEAILRAAGAREDVPDFGIIRLVRPSSGFARVIFRRNGTNDANRYTLLEALAVHYGVVLAPRVAMSAPGVPRASANVGRARVPVAPQPFAGPPSYVLQFPDWKRVVIRRPEPDGLHWTEIPVDVAEIFAEGGCGRDVVLKWGDVIEVPEQDHPVGERGSSVQSELLGACQKCLSRSVTFTVGGKMEKRRVSCDNSRFGQDPFTLSGALNGSRLVRTSSDTSRVLLRRTDPATGKTTEITVNCRDADGEGAAFWLREGDEIVVPDLR
jgi:ankyrin repeat protein